ncbi:hypothetical protein ACK3TF_004715 [Chlorella vulgaris]
MPACRLKGFACCCGGLGCPVDDRLRGLRDEWDLSTLACGWAVVRSRAQRVCDAEAEEAEGPPGTIGVFIPSYSLALAHDPLLCASTAHPFKGQDRGFEPDRPGQQYQRSHRRLPAIRRGAPVLAGRKLGVLAAGSIEAAVALAAGGGTRIWPPNGLTAPDHSQQQQRAAQHFP